MAALAQPFLKPSGAIAIAAGPRLGAVPVPAVFAIVRIFDAKQLKVFFPIGTLLL